MDANNTVSISPEYLRELMEAKLALEGVRQDRDQERESWERLYSHFRSECHFIIRTLDGQLCYVQRGPSLAKSAHTNPATGRRELMLACRAPMAPFNHGAVEYPLATLRTIRTYIEGKEQIRGVPIFDEVHPEDRS